MTKLSGYVETFITDEEKDNISRFIDELFALAIKLKEEVNGKQYTNKVSRMLWFADDYYYSEKKCLAAYPDILNTWLDVENWSGYHVLYNTNLTMLISIHNRLTIANTILLTTSEAYALTLARRAEYKIA